MKPNQGVDVLARWEQMLAAYEPEQVAHLEAAAVIQDERIKKAALDPANSRIVDGLDISALWFAVERRRDELLLEAVVKPADADINFEPLAEVDIKFTVNAEEAFGLAQEPAEAPAEPAGADPDEEELKAITPSVSEAQKAPAPVTKPRAKPGPKKGSTRKRAPKG